jgi:hypothetical protein
MNSIALATGAAGFGHAAARLPAFRPGIRSDYSTRGAPDKKRGLTATLGLLHSLSNLKT